MTILRAFAAFLLAAALGPKGTTAVAPPPREIPPKRVVPRPTEYFGHVLAVEGQSITIRGTENELPNDEVVIRRFPAGVSLGAGKQDWNERSIDDYRLTDVRVGDQVYIRIHHKGDEDVCAAVRIRRRPGGVVPPAPWDNPEADAPYHERMNAWQAFEEKFIPLPPKFDPFIQRLKGEESDRQDKEILARLRWERNHTAPPPRKVKR